MEIRSGVDMFYIPRMERAVKEDNSVYFRNVFTSYERQCAEQHSFPTAYYATRFAAKEAVFKTLTTQWLWSMAWSQIEIRSKPCGGLYIMFNGQIAKIVKDMKIIDISVSVSWDTDYAIAYSTLLLV